MEKAMKLTFEQKTKRFRELMDELSKQLDEASSDIIKIRQDVDEMLAKIHRNMILRQEAISYMDSVFKEESKNGKIQT